ncbi:MAG: hypothetical protein LQ347_005868 [Umbilicaria vellea]|nr:MAG: hypothetical protein LQ347_005868 [Umbilicaria vellea]
MARWIFCVSAVWLFALLISTASASPHYRRQNQSDGPALPNTRLAEPVVFADGTYPRANKLADGSLIGAYTAFVDGNSVITLIKSCDNGDTWSFQGTAAQGFLPILTFLVHSSAPLLRPLFSFPLPNIFPCCLFPDIFSHQTTTNNATPTSQPTPTTSTTPTHLSSPRAGSSSPTATTTKTPPQASTPSSASRSPTPTTAA